MARRLFKLSNFARQSQAFQILKSDEAAKLILYLTLFMSPNPICTLVYFLCT